MTRLISVIAKFYAHRAMYTVRQILGIPNWNAERAEIYAKITDAEAEERLQRLSANLTAPESSEDREMYDYFVSVKTTKMIVARFSKDSGARSLDGITGWTAMALS
jgi:hypothetical protein